MGEGTGGGGGVRPVAVLMVSDEGIRVESPKGTILSLAEGVSGVVTKVIGKREAATPSARGEAR
jgi:uncharacterized spore protein YtfJ